MYFKSCLRCLVVFRAENKGITFYLLIWVPFCGTNRKLKKKVPNTKYPFLLHSVANTFRNKSLRRENKITVALLTNVVLIKGVQLVN